MTIPSHHPHSGSARTVTTELIADFGTTGHGLSGDGWIGEADQNASSHAYADGVLTRSMIPDANCNPTVLYGNSLAAEISNRGYSYSADQAATEIDSLISAHGTTPTRAGDGGLQLTGLAEAAARIGIHLDETLFDTVAADGFGLWHRPGTSPAYSHEGRHRVVWPARR